MSFLCLQYFPGILFGQGSKLQMNLKKLKFLKIEQTDKNNYYLCIFSVAESFSAICASTIFFLYIKMQT